LEQEIGVEKALDYKSPNFFNDVKKHVGYLDVYFDNVGGESLLVWCLKCIRGVDQFDCIQERSWTSCSHV